MSSQTDDQAQKALALLEKMHSKYGSVVEAFGFEGDERKAMGMYARQLAESGKVLEPCQIFEGLVELEADNAYFHCCLGALYMRLDRLDEARASFEHTLAIDPQDVAALTYLGELMLQAGDLEGGLRELQKASDLDPQGRDPHANRARALVAVAETTGQVAAPVTPKKV